MEDDWNMEARVRLMHDSDEADFVRIANGWTLQCGGRRVRRVRCHPDDRAVLARYVRSFIDDAGRSSGRRPYSERGFVSAVIEESGRMEPGVIVLSTN